MARSVPTAAVLFLLISIIRTSAAEGAASFSHIRSNQPELLEAVAAASRISPTFRRLEQRLSASDVVVYLGSRMATESGVAGGTSFLASTHGVRYVHVWIDSRLMGGERFALLGHELHHAVEIAGAPVVVDARSLEAFYGKVGFRSSPSCRRCFESAAAIAAGRQIRREVLDYRAGASGRRERAGRSRT